MTAHMQKKMEALLACFDIIPFQDDIAIASKDAETHKKTVLDVLEALTYKAGLRLQLNKCKFFRQKPEYLDLSSVDGIRMDPEKIKAICNWPNLLMEKQCKDSWSCQFPQRFHS